MKLKDIKVGMDVAYVSYKGAEPERATVVRTGLVKRGYSWNAKYVQPEKPLPGESAVYVELSIDRPNGAVTHYKAAFVIPGEYEAEHAKWAQRRAEAVASAKAQADARKRSEERSAELYARLEAFTGVKPLWQGLNQGSFSIRFDELEQLLELAEAAKAAQS